MTDLQRAIDERPFEIGEEADVILRENVIDRVKITSICGPKVCVKSVQMRVGAESRFGLLVGEGPVTPNHILVMLQPDPCTGADIFSERGPIYSLRRTVAVRTSVADQTQLKGSAKIEPVESI